MSWGVAYQVVAYAAFVICLFAAVRIWIKSGWVQGLWQLVVLLGFVIVYWLLESYAHLRAPFYTYPPGPLIYMIPYFTGFPTYAPVMDPCATQAGSEIPLSVLLMEASLTFGLLWTARLLVVVTTPTFLPAPYRALLIPFMTGLVALLVDLPLDPILSDSCECTPVTNTVNPVCPHDADEVDRQHGGLTFWQWFAEPEAKFLDQWYGVPMFNFAIWYCAPVALAASAILLGWMGPVSSWLAAAIQALIAFVFGVAAFTAPSTQPPKLQLALMVLAILVSLTIVFPAWSTFRRDNPFRWEFVVPSALFALFPLVALLAGANGMQTGSWLLVVSLVATLLTLFFLIAPYWKWP